MNYINSVFELIGNTPLLKINNFEIPNNNNIFVKLEQFNPGGSTKDRIGKLIIEEAEKEGLLKKGFTIIEATAGNTGIGIALSAINKGYEVIFVVPGKFSIEKQVIMKALGAKIIPTPTELGMKGAFEKVKELEQTLKNVFVINQFKNKYNPLAHYLTTGKEIFEQLEGKINYFVAGAGSGGTFSGVMKYLKEKNENIKGVLSDPIGSILGGGECHSYKIEGIGNDFIPETMDLSLVDDVVKVSDENAFYYVKQLALKEGMIVGSSSGSNFYSALEIAKKVNNKNIVTLFPDGADRYLSKNIYGV